MHLDSAVVENHVSGKDHSLSKFVVPVAVYLKHIFGLYNICFLIKKKKKKAKIKKAGNLNEGRSYVITTVKALAR